MDHTSGLYCTEGSPHFELIFPVIFIPKVGGFILYGLTPPKLRSTLGSNALFCPSLLGPSSGCVTQLQGIGVELLTVFLLVFVVLAITDEKRESKVSISRIGSFLHNCFSITFM